MCKNEWFGGIMEGKTAVFNLVRWIQATKLLKLFAFLHLSSSNDFLKKNVFSNFSIEFGRIWRVAVKIGRTCHQPLQHRMVVVVVFCQL